MKRIFGSINLKRLFRISFEELKNQVMYIPFEEIDEAARIWIYQSNIELSDAQVKYADHALKLFVDAWEAHGQKLTASYKVAFNRFVILAVDEAASGVTGCSIDKSVALINQFNQEFGVDFLDRMTVTYRLDGAIQAKKMHDFWAMRKANIVDDQTVVFNNLVKTKGEFDTQWETSFSKSWHAQMW